MFKKIMLILVILTGVAFSQGYDETIDSYTIFFRQCDQPAIIYEGAEIDTIVGDTSLTFAWENGQIGDPSYYTLNVGVMTAMVILNDPSIWVSGSAVATRDIVLDTGMYECTVIAEDELANRSGYSFPFYSEYF